MVEIFDTDGSTMEIFLCMDLQTSNCLTLDYFYDPNGENSMLYYGTDQGFVNIFHFKNEKLTSSGITRQRESIETLFLERDPRLFKEWGTLWKRKTHSDWTLRVRYIPTAKLLISCSVDAKDSLAISFLDFAQKWQFSATSITKGANCLAFSLNPPCIITGGSDYNVRFWNPRRITTPIATLSGHSAPVIDLSVSNSNGQMVSLAIDKELRVWDIRRQHCLQSFTNHTKQQPENIFSSLYCDDARKVILASSALYYHKLNGRITHTDSVKMPSESIKACLLSNTFQSVVCGYEGGSIVIWDIATGERSFMFFETHGASEISAMCLGSNGRRLITGARDGTIRTWNFNNGQVLQDVITNERSEIVHLYYVDMKDSGYIISVGANRRICVFKDDTNALTLHPTFSWPESGAMSKRRWHNDDITSVVFCPPATLAAGNYDGQILLTNFDSGHVTHVLNAYSGQYMRSVDKMLFLISRKAHGCGSLVSAGADGYIRFWDTNNGTLVYERKCTKDAVGILDMVCDTQEKIIYVGDSGGQISLWNIEQAGIKDKIKGFKENNMMLIHSFVGHKSAILSISLLEAKRVILTLGQDQTLRLFTTKGESIGIFGQEGWVLSKNLQYSGQVSPIQLKKSDSRHAPSFELDDYSATEFLTSKQSHQEYDSWFQKSIYAKEFLCNKPKKTIRPLTRSYGTGVRVYNKLMPVDFTETKLPQIKKS